MCHYLIFEQNAENSLDNGYIIRESGKDYSSPLERFSVVTDTFKRFLDDLTKSTMGVHFV